MLVDTVRKPYTRNLSSLDLFAGLLISPRVCGFVIYTWPFRWRRGKKSVVVKPVNGEGGGTNLLESQAILKILSKVSCRFASRVPCGAILLKPTVPSICCQHWLMYEGHLESKERFAIQRYLLIIGKKKNMQVV